MLPVIFPVSKYGIDPLIKNQVPTGRQQLLHRNLTDQLEKSAEVVLMQMGQDRQDNCMDLPFPQERQQRCLALKGTAAGIHHDAFTALRRIQQHHDTVGPAHIQNMQLVHVLPIQPLSGHRCGSVCRGHAPLHDKVLYQLPRTAG